MDAGDDRRVFFEIGAAVEGEIRFASRPDGEVDHKGDRGGGG